MKRLGAIVASAIACAAPAACGESPPESTPVPDAAALGDAGVEASNDEGPFPTLPYPAGPYGSGISDVFPDLRVQGYALTRAQRDSKKLPFRDVRVSEVRSDPRCKCLVVLFNAAGEKCGFCASASQALAAIVASDTSVCALETFHFTYDTLLPGEDLQPPTRADLDLSTQAARQPYPVGLLSPEALVQIGADAIPAIPDFFFVRPSDMRIIGFTAGLGNALATEVRTRCSGVQTVETIATLSRPRRLIVDAGFVYVTDVDLGLVRIPVAGGAPQVLAKPSASPDAFAIDGADVFFATRSGSAPFEIGRVAKTGGGATTLVTSPVAYRSLAVDVSHVYFTRDDGVVGRVARGGGAPETIIVEVAATSVQVDATDVYWVENAAGDIVSIPKAGGERRVVVKGTRDLEYGTLAKDIILGATEIYFNALGPTAGQGYVTSKRGGGFPRHAFDAYSPSLAFDPGTEDLALAAMNPHTRSAVIGTSLAADRAVQKTAFRIINPGQRDVVSVGGDGVYLYWATDGQTSSGTGVVKRLRRP